jgi:hypothetical protein
VSKILVEVLLSKDGAPIDVTASKDVAIIFRFSDMDKVFIPKVRIDVSILHKFLRSDKTYGSLTD